MSAKRLLLSNIVSLKKYAHKSQTEAVEMLESMTSHTDEIITAFEPYLDYTRAVLSARNWYVHDEIVGEYPQLNAEFYKNITSWLKTLGVT